jgi:glycosyltransferase involved in cell wall biosynthesis
VKITLVVPFVNLTGGIRMVLDYANVLTAAHHDVRVVYPTWPYRFESTRWQHLRELGRALRTGRRVPWFGLRARLVRVPLIRTAFLPPADVVIATSWPTVHDVARLPRSRGVKVHWLMHDERGSGPERRVRATYAFSTYRIGLSRLVALEVEREHGCRIDAIVPAGVDSETFFPDGTPAESTVLMLYHPGPRKGAADGLRALARLREIVPSLVARACGPIRPPGWPDWIRFTFRPTDRELRRLYATSTALLYPSCYEGFGLPPLEAMACGCPVVTTRVGAMPEVARDRDNSLVVDPGDVEAMVARLRELLEDSALRCRLRVRGLETAQRYSVKHGAALFEDALRRACAEQGRAM